MPNIERRSFLKLSGLSVLPMLAGFHTGKAQQLAGAPLDNDKVMFMFDGPFYDPATYLNKLNEINNGKKIRPDSYGEGGTLDELLKHFASVTKKESAIYMPTGTMANQLAIHILSGENTKVFVQETSHVFRDEADAAQSVFRKRLIPLAKGEAYFSASDLAAAIEYYNKGEVFKSGNGGVVSIEMPVRRAEGAFLPYEALKAVTDEARNAGYKLHLDGARIYMAAAASGRSVADYSELFDTVYISLYKYLGASGGAVLCGSAEVIGKLHHHVKVHGGTMYSSWGNAAMALHHLDGIDERLQKVRNKGTDLVKALNNINRVKVSAAVKNHTNIYHLKFSKPIDSRKVIFSLREMHNILLAEPNADGNIRLVMNDTLLSIDNNTIAESFKTAIKTSLGK